MKSKTETTTGPRPRCGVKKVDLDKICDSRPQSAQKDRILAKSPTFVSEKTYKSSNRASFLSARPSTSRTYQSYVTNDIKVREHSKSDHKEKSALLKMEPAFMDVSREVAGLTVWRLEGKTRLVEIDERDHGFFHEGSTYIILQVTEEKETSLHYWFGEFAHEDMKTVIEEKAHELDRIVTNAIVFSKECQSHESPCFLRLFPEGIVYIESKPKTTVSRASVYSKRMYKISGRKYIRASCMEPTLSSLDSDKACILDGFPRIYVWIGNNCEYSLRTKTIHLAKRIRKLQRNGIAHIIVIDEKDEAMNRAFRKKLYNNCSDSSEEKQNQHSTQTVENTVPDTGMILYRVSGDRVLYDMPEAATRPLYQRYLVQRDCYMLDRGPQYPLYVWLGSQANENEILNAVKRGKTFCKHKQYPDTIPICRIKDDHEPDDFKKNFYDWREKDTKHRQLTKRYSIGNIERALFSQKDKRTIAKKDELWSEDTLLDGEQSTEIWKIDGDNLVKVEVDQHIIFNNGCSYVILHRIANDAYVQKVLYYWLGSKLQNDNQDTVLDLVLCMNNTLNNKCIIIRVLDGREPAHFMTVMNNCLVINDKDLTEVSIPESRMYCVHEHENYSMKIEQVPVCSASLNSSASYIVFTSYGDCFLWYGQKSGGNEREYAKHIIGYLSPPSKYDFEIMTEGKESKPFWNCVGQYQEYPLQFSKQILERRPPRLIHCGSSNEKIKFDAIDGFKQEDLCEDGIFILDTYDQIYMWAGHDLPNALSKKIPEFLKCYIDQDPAERNDVTINIWILAQSNEPEAFTKFFPFWTTTGISGKNSYELCRKTTRQENIKIEVEVEMVDRSYVGKVKYPYKELLKKELPGDVDPYHKEQHLSEKQFKEAVRLPRDEFYRLPMWKQEQLFKSARLGANLNSSNPFQLRISSPEM